MLYMETAKINNKITYIFRRFFKITAMCVDTNTFQKLIILIEMLIMFIIYVSQLELNLSQTNAYIDSKTCVIRLCNIYVYYCVRHVEYMTLTARINKCAYSFGHTYNSQDMLINNYYIQRHIILYNLINCITTYSGSSLVN